MSDPEARSYPLGPPDRLELDAGYAWLREHEPLARITMPYGEPAWLVTRYEDVRTVLGDSRFGRAAAATRDPPRMYPEPVPGGITDLDPPEHTRMRRLIGTAFTARRVELLRPRAEGIADELLDRMVCEGPPADLVEAYAVPLPAVIICELLGVPYEDRPTFQTWADAYMTTTAIPLEEKTARLGELGAYFAGLVARRREDPADDLISALTQARDERDGLSEEELIGFLMTLLAAGYETTAGQIANFAYALMSDPAQLLLVRGGKADVAGAVEELLRHVPVMATGSTFIPRYATEDVELSGGTVRAGEPVFAAFYAANRDPRVYADPERLDLTRPPRPHLAFGHGAHFCAGAALARMELQVALHALLRRLPGLRAAVADEELVWKSGMVVRGPVALPVTWELSM